MTVPLNIRNDLQSPNVSCSWSEEDPMVGTSFYGALDVKIMDRYHKLILYIHSSKTGETYETEGLGRFFLFIG